MCTIISQEQVVAPDVVNIMVDESFYKEENILFIESQAMEAVFCSFVHFVEEHYEYITEMIQKRKKGNDHFALRSDIVYEVLAEFWSSHGIDYMTSLNLSNKPDFVSIYEENMWKSEDLIEVFVKAVRMNVHNYYFVKKKNMEQNIQDAIYFDEMYLYFPVAVLKNLLERQGLLNQRSKILSELKCRDLIRTDEVGISRKLQVSKGRFEVYQISRQIFNRDGEIEIVSLGKEREAYV